MLMTYLAFVFAWTIYRGIETYMYERPQSRPYFVGFLITEVALAPFSLAIELMDGGTLRERIRAAYSAAKKEKDKFDKTGVKKTIG